MKREREVDRPGITVVKTFFKWLECVSCGFEYRRDPMWRIVKGPYYGGVGKVVYCCPFCASDKQEAEKVFNKYFGRPPAPPVPPPKRKLAY